MPLVRTADLIEPAHAVAAFNVITLEHAEAIAAAERAESPAILQIGHNTVRFHGGSFAPDRCGDRGRRAVVQRATVGAP